MIMAGMPYGSALDSSNSTASPTWMSFAPYQARTRDVLGTRAGHGFGNQVKPGAGSRSRDQLALHGTYPVDKRNQDRSDYRGTFRGWPFPNVGRVELDQRHHLQMIVQIVAECRWADSGQRRATAGCGASRRKQRQRSARTSYAESVIRSSSNAPTAVSPSVSM